jgi:hypothetical protein
LRRRSRFERDGEPTSKATLGGAGGDVAQFETRRPSARSNGRRGIKRPNS